MANDKRFIAKNGLDNNSKTITNVTNPLNAQDAATKSYVDAQVATAGTFNSWTISDGTFSEAISDSDTLTVTGTGASTVSYNVATNTLTINSTDTNTTYGAASATVLGLVKLEDNTVQSVAANAVSATASRTYGIQVNSSGQLVVNVPWVDTNTETESFRTQTVTDTDTGYTWTATGSAVADNANDTLTWVSGSGIDIDVDAALDAIRITNTAPDQTVTLTGSGATSVSGTYPNFTISSTDTNTVYTLPTATSTVKGGIELFSDTVQSVAANAVSATASRTYGIQLNSAGQAVVNVPWVDTNTNTTYSAGTGLSLTGTTFSVDSTIATESYVTTAISNLVSAAPTTLDTLNELAAALGDDPNFATTVTNSIATKAASSITITAGGGLTGGGNLTANRTISHADTSTAVNLTASSRTYVSGLTFDTYGHVTGYTTGTETVTNTETESFRTQTVTDTDTGYTWAATGSAVADSANDTLTWVSGSGINIDVDAALDAIRITNTSPDQTVTLTGSGATSVSGTYPNFTISSTDTNTVYTLPTATSTVKGGIELFSDTVQSVAANAVSATASRTYGVQLNSAGQAVVNVPWVDTNTNTTYSAGSGITLTGTTFSNAAPDQTVTLTGSGATSVSGTYPNFTISSTDTNTTYGAASSTVPGLVELFSDTVQSVAANAVSATASRTYGVQVNSAGQAVVNVPWVDTNTNTTYTAGTGLTLSGTTFSNTAPDQTVTLTGSGATSVSGTYPNFTISSTDTNTVYTLPAATSTTLGGIELFSDTVQSVAANAVSATASRTYGVQVNSAGQAVVNVPWTNTETESFRTQTVTDTDTGFTWAATGSAIADNANDTLTWVSGSGINIDVDATLDAIRISNTYSYTLPAATSTALGGIELFSDTVQSVAANAVSATASRTYGIQVNSDGQAVVNVPWVNTNTDTKITTTNDTADATRYVPFVTTAAENQAAQTNTSFTFNPSTVTLSVTNITGTSSAAKYSDVAERYETDEVNEAGTIMVFGGDKEVTASTKYAQTKIAGVISTDPAYMMNSDAGSDETHPYIALQGRVPCKVVGKVRKGDIIVASEYKGVGQAWSNEDIDPRMTAYVGIAIENKDSAGVGLVEVKVGK